MVNYNGISCLGDCLDSLQRQHFRDFETIVVDNASTDNSIPFIMEKYPDALVIRSRKNLGYGGGINEGIKASSGEHIIILNNDTKASPEWIGELIKTAEKHPDAGMCASKVLNEAEPGVIDNTGLVMYRDGIARGRGRLERDRGQYEEEEEVFLPSGCAAHFRRRMLEEIGLFDEDFFMYLEDVDIGLRGRLAGWKCRYSPRAVVYHKYSATAGPYSPMKAYLVERNRIYAVIKNFPAGQMFKNPFWTFLRYITQAYGSLAGKGASARLAKSQSPLGIAMILVKAYLHAGMKIPELLEKRRRIRQAKKIDNKEFSRLLRRFGAGVKEIALKD